MDQAGCGDRVLLEWAFSPVVAIEEEWLLGGGANDGLEGFPVFVTLYITIIV